MEHKYREPKRTRREVAPAPRQVSIANVARRLRRTGASDGKLGNKPQTRTRTIVTRDEKGIIASVKRIVQFLHPTKGWK